MSPDSVLARASWSWAYKAEWRRVWSDRTFMTAAGKHFGFAWPMVPQVDPGAHPPRLDTASGRLSGEGWFPVRTNGTPPFTLRRLKPQATTLTLNHYVSEAAGSHDLKLGYDFQIDSSQVGSNANSGHVRYLDDSANDRPFHVDRIMLFSMPAEDAIGSDDRNRYHVVFIQDTWRPTDRLSMILGIRYEQQRTYFLETRELADGADAELKELAELELAELEARRDDVLAEIRSLMVPKDPNDEKNVVLEIRAGTGGDEAGLFGHDLFRMYARFAERQHWKVDVLSKNESRVGAINEVVAVISAGRNATSCSAESPTLYIGGAAEPTISFAFPNTRPTVDARHRAADIGRGGPPQAVRPATTGLPRGYRRGRRRRHTRSGALMKGQQRPDNAESERGAIHRPFRSECADRERKTPRRGGRVLAEDRGWRPTPRNRR